jgi:hypothetical protein
MRELLQHESGQVVCENGFVETNHHRNVTSGDRSSKIMAK